MNSDNTSPIATDEQVDMQPSYDFAKGVRGKHARLLQRGYRVIIHKQDGTTEEQDYRLPHSAVLLDPDVQKFFPDTESVNRALRGLISLIPTASSVTK